MSAAINMICVLEAADTTTNRHLRLFWRAGKFQQLLRHIQEAADWPEATASFTSDWLRHVPFTCVHLLIQS